MLFGKKISTQIVLVWKKYY